MCPHIEKDVCFLTRENLIYVKYTLEYNKRREIIQTIQSLNTVLDNRVNKIISTVFLANAGNCLSYYRRNYLRVYNS